MHKGLQNKTTTRKHNTCCISKYSQLNAYQLVIFWHITITCCQKWDMLILVVSVEIVLKCLLICCLLASHIYSGYFIPSSSTLQISHEVFDSFVTVYLNFKAGLLEFYSGLLLLVIWSMCYTHSHSSWHVAMHMHNVLL